MESMRSTWTDERLDDLNAKVDAGFERVDGEFAALRTEMNARFDAVDRTLASLNRTLIQCGFGLTGSVVCLVIAFVLTGR
jgi:hypothetical protein